MMKRINVFVLLLSVCSTVSSADLFLAGKDGALKWDKTNTWSRWNGSSWEAAGALPTASDDVLIGSATEGYLWTADGNVDNDPLFIRSYSQQGYPSNNSAYWAYCDTIRLANRANVPRGLQIDGTLNTNTFLLGYEAGANPERGDGDDSTPYYNPATVYVHGNSGAYADVNIGTIENTNSVSGTTFIWTQYGGTVDVGSIILNTSLLSYQLEGGTLTVTSSVTGTNMDLNIAGGTLVMTNSVFTNLVANGSIIQANGTAVNTGNLNELLSVDTTTSPGYSIVTIYIAPPEAATSPSPNTGDTGVSVDSNLSWTAGLRAGSHNVHFGKTNPPPFVINQSGTTYDPDISEYNTTYYWRIDEVNGAGTTTGTVWNFTTSSPPATASIPSPANAATSVSLTTDLDWTAGQQALSHDVYWGTSQTAVANAQRLTGDIDGDGTVNITDISILAVEWLTNPGAVNHSADIIYSSKVDFEDFAALAADWYFTADAEFIGNQTSTTFDVGTLAESTTYYWKIDEVNASQAASPWTGSVWNFTTASAMFNPVVHYTMDDNASNATVIDSSGNGHNGSYWSGTKTISTNQGHSADRIQGTGSMFFEGRNDKVVITGYKGVTGKASRTCSAWVKTSSLGDGDILSWGEEAAGKRWLFTINNGLLRAAINSGYRQGMTTINDGQWHHVAAVIEDDGSPNTSEIKLYVDGIEESTYTTLAYAINTGSIFDVQIGLYSSKYFQGLIDDVRIYDSALSASEIALIANAESAKYPYPANPTTNVSINTNLSCMAGNSATSHNVYFGTTNPPAFQGNQSTTSFDPGVLTTGTIYYWQVDEVSASGTTAGRLWSFTTENYTSAPSAASAASPPHTETNVWKDVDLHWTAGTNATSHNVYFGTDSSPDAGEFKGNQFDTSYELGTLADNTTYYWRIDEVNNYGTTTGTIWRFTTETGSRLAPEDFAIMAWDSTRDYTRAELDTMRACGINVFGFPKPDQFDLIADAGLKAFALEWDCVAKDAALTLDQVEIDRRVSAMVNSVYDHPGLFGYFLRDEPPVDEFDELNNWMVSFHAADPDHWVYLNMGWPYDWTSLLSEIPSVDYLSYDMYGVQENGAINYWYFYNLENARDASISSGLPLWNTVASIDMDSDNPDWDTAPPALENLRFQAYTSMAYGVKGISWFTYFSENPAALAPIHMGNKSSAWYDMQDVNMDIHRIGPAYLELVNSQVFHHPNVPYGGRSISHSSYINNITGGDFCVGEFWKAGESGIGYLMVVNKSLTTTANFNISYKWSSTEYRMNSSTGQWETLESYEKYLAPGEGMLVKFDTN